MRDALSLLDQIIAHADDAICTADVKQALGYTQLDYALMILQALASLDAPKLLNLSKAIAEEGGHYTYVLREVLAHLHQLSLLHVLPKASEQNTELYALHLQLSPEDTQLLYQIALKGLDELPLAPTYAIGFEMTLLRMHTFRPLQNVPTPPLAYTQSSHLSPQVHVEASAAAVPALSKPPRTEQAKPTPPATPKPPHIEEPKSEPGHAATTWQDMIPHLKLSGLALNAARHAEFELCADGRTAELCILQQNEPLFTENVRKTLEKRLSEYYQKEMRIALKRTEQVSNSPAEQTRLKEQAKQKANDATLEADPSFQQLQALFSSDN